MTMPPLPDADYLLAIPDQPYDRGYVTTEDGYTEGQMLDYAAAVRAATLEEAIGKAMEWTEAARKDGREYGVGMDIAAAIRALISSPAR